MSRSGSGGKSGEADKEDVGDIGEVGIIDYNKINNGLQVGSSLQAIIGFIL